MTGPVIRPGGEADVAPLAALESAVFGADAWSASIVRAALPGILVSGDPVTAYAAWHLSGDVADLDRIAVAPGSRRTGRASALLHAVLDVARNAGADWLMLEVRADNQAAIALYTQTGLDQLDRRRRYYADDTDAVVMSLDLRGGPSGDLGASGP